MTERQFERLVAARRRQSPALFERRGIARWLERVARQAQRRFDAEAAWERIAEPEWLDRTRVVAFAGGRLTIATFDASLSFTLRRREAALVAALRPYVPGLRSMRFAPAGGVDG